ncbi:MAG TPA: hypothetical protein VGE74_18205, partial [Gemmata sp.]
IASADGYAELLPRLTGTNLIGGRFGLPDGFESAAVEPVGAELIDLLYTANAPATGFEHAHGDPFGEQIRSRGSARLRRAASRW